MLPGPSARNLEVSSFLIISLIAGLNCFLEHRELNNSYQT